MLLSGALVSYHAERKSVKADLLLLGIDKFTGHVKKCRVPLAIQGSGLPIPSRQTPPIPSSLGNVSATVTVMIAMTDATTSASGRNE